MGNLEIDLPHQVLFFSNDISDLTLSGNIVNMKCCRYCKIVQHLSSIVSSKVRILGSQKRDLFAVFVFVFWTSE